MGRPCRSTWEARRLSRVLAAIWYRLSSVFVAGMPMRRHRLAMTLMGVPWLRPAISRFDGIFWPVFPSVESTWSLPFGVKDRGPRAVFRSMMRCADAFIDGGANLGWYSCLAAAAGVPEVVAVEPVPQTARMLRRIGVWNKFEGMRVIGCALGTSRGVARFMVPDAPFPEMGHVGSGGEGRLRDVQVLGLADVLGMLAAERRRIVVKLDVEGHELSVMRGGVPAAFRDRIAGIVIEVHLGCFDAPGEALAELAGAIECIGSPMVMIPDDPEAGPLTRFWRNATGRFPLRPAADADVRRRVAAREIREVYLLARRAEG